MRTGHGDGGASVSVTDERSDLWAGEPAGEPGRGDQGRAEQQRAEPRADQRADQRAEPRAEPRADQRSGDAFERTPPQDVAAEQCALGGMLLSKDAIADVIEIL